jgi:hypothetical protein
MPEPTFTAYADNLMGILNGVKELLIKEGLRRTGLS